MHITDLHIDRFGIWRDLTLPLGGPGLNVLYGPNEAGKSTLMRFVKAALYGGVPPRAETEPSADDGRTIAGGLLKFVGDGKAYTVRRQFTASGGRHVQLVGPNDEPLPVEKLDELLCGTSEAVFDRVFAVDLYELQELATLDLEELAGRVYGLSLSGRGQKLLAAVDDLRRRREALLSTDGRSGLLARLLGREQALHAEFRALPDLPSLQSDLFGQRDALDTEIASIKRRRTDLQHELRGRRFLDRVHPAWRQVRVYSAELTKLRPAADLPSDGLAQLDAVDRESESLTRRRDECRRQAADAKRRTEANGPEPEIVRAEPAVRAMLDLRGWLKEAIAARQRAADAKADTSKSAKLARTGTGPEWTEQRLAAVDTSPAAQLTLTNSARSYRLALGRRSELRKKYRRLQQATAKREALVEQRLERIGKTPDAAAAELRKRLASLGTLTELRAKEAAIDRRDVATRQRFDHLAERLDVPPWVSFVLAIFAVGGAIFAVLGLVTGVITSAVAGAAYLLLGVTCGSIAFKLKSHFDIGLTEMAEQLRDERHNEEAELRKVREEIARLAGATGPAPAANPNATSPPAESDTIADAVRDAVKEFAALDEVVDDQERIRRRRKLLTTLRARLRKVQQSVEVARQEWCDTLTRVGLPESLDIEASLALWQQLAEAAAAGVSAAPAAREYELLDGMVRSFGAQLEAMGRRIKVWNGDASRPLEALDHWEKELETALRRSAERKKHVEEYKRARQEAAAAEERLADLARQRTALLAAAGVKSRADYERRLEAAERRREVEGLLELAQAELETLASAEPELAIAEEDLRSFRPEENTAALGRLVKEQEELEAKLETALERRGGLARRLDELEANDRTADLRRKKSRLDPILRKATERLLAVTLAEQAAEQARAAYERDRQPPVLAAASKSLARLTRNRYVRIWAPLGERTLRVDDDHGRTFAIEQLSGGTREQLFLALRLGLVRHAAERGVSLPLILDDVFVNFDQLRTEAAFETLRDFADEGRQVLFFTCHLHLAHLAENRGIDPIWLPGHQPPMQQRLAG